MATYLNENQAGVDTTVAFPNIRTCQGVFCQMTNGSIVGAHFTNKDSEQQVAANMKQLIDQNGGIDAVKSMVVAQNVNEMDAQNASDQAVQNPSRGISNAAEKAALLGFDGPVKLLDLARMKTGGSTYVQMTSGGLLDDPEITYKRDEKMKYEAAYGTRPNILGNRQLTVAADLREGATMLHKVRERDLIPVQGEGAAVDAGVPGVAAEEPAVKRTRDSIKLGGTSSSSLRTKGPAV